MVKNPAISKRRQHLTRDKICLKKNPTSLLGSSQVSVLTDQVEAQGEKIRDLDMCLDEHRDKLNATEEMLQQVCVRLVCNVPPGSESFHMCGREAHFYR